ncbi:hypothetical protein CO731_04892 [Aminobacter sp. MSH1]|uniref:hypothetical protein n=1 Tax=Aminobacter sp. MSH1 TaxID=374606 RepID=UPI000D3BAD0D|nr:hypothetical protein [Aminobacter sp. MSH1]AWC25397.1 hypothetical protein CO731_04892 [Aminobacter sp. MSH1]
MTPIIRGASMRTDDRDPPDGLREYEAQVAIRNLIQQDGIEAAREKIAFYLIDEAKGERH